MKTSEQKTVLYLDLEKREAAVKAHRELYPYLGGKGLAVKIGSELAGGSPVILANGPFTLYFPYAAHTYVLFRSPTSGQFEESYLGGSFGAMLALAGYDALVVNNRARRPLYVAVDNEQVNFRTLREDGEPLWQKEGRAGLRAVLTTDHGGRVDNHFSFGTAAVGETLQAKGLLALVVSGSQTYPLNDSPTFEKAYRELLAAQNQLPVKKGNHPSCFGCPLGCERAAGGAQQMQGTNLSPFLVACPFIGDFYSSIPLVFSLLSLLGIKLAHEHLEALPKEIEQLQGTLL